MKVWVLDLVGYDARGGNARVFSSLAAAQGAAPTGTRWKREGGEWVQEVAYPGSTADLLVIYECEVEGPVPVGEGDEPSRGGEP